MGSHGILYKYAYHPEVLYGDYFVVFNGHFRGQVRCVVGREETPVQEK